MFSFRPVSSFISQVLRILLAIALFVSGTVEAGDPKSSFALSNTPENKTSALTEILPLSTTSEGSGTSFKTVDDFETHNWHGLLWADPNEFSYSSQWKTHGNYSCKLKVLSSSIGWAAYTSGNFDAETPDQIRLDIKTNESPNSIVPNPGLSLPYKVYIPLVARNYPPLPQPMQQRLKLEILDSSGSTYSLGSISLAANTEYRNVTFNSSGRTIRMLRFIQDGYTLPVTVYVDNIRFVKNSVVTLWDSCESHFYWDGTADADNPDGQVARTDDITQAVHSSKAGSSASLVMEWNKTVSPANSAEIQAKGLNLDYRDYWYFKFDVYRPSGTPNVSLLVYLYDGSKGVGTVQTTIDTPNQWKTFILPLHEANDLSHLTEIKFVVPETDQYASGRLYLDNLQVGGFLPEANPIDLNTLGYPHMVKDYSDNSLWDNNFCGIANIGNDDQHKGSITQQLSQTNYYTQPALQINYNVTTPDSYVFYFNTLELNSVKSHLALYLKAGLNSPGRVKLELHDANWLSAPGQNGLAYVYLSGLSQTQWKQWIIPVDPTQWQVVGSFDSTRVVEVVISLDNRTAASPSGIFYVDDITFVDKTKSKLPYPGLVCPEQMPVDVQQLGVPYLLNDYDGRVLNAEGGVEDLDYNEFFGLTGVGSNSGPNVVMGTISHVPTGGFAHSIPNAYRIGYYFPEGVPDASLFYYDLMSVAGGTATTKDLSFTEKLSLWLRGDPSGNPAMVKVEFHDVNWGLNGNWTSGKAYAILKNVSGTEWRQYLVSTKVADLIVTGSFDITRLKEVVISFDYGMVKDKSGALYLDDMQFVDTDQKFTTAQDFTSDNFLELVERRTFQYFLEGYDPTTGLVLDRLHFRDMATTAGTGFGLTAKVIGVERGWISREAGEAYVAQVLNTLWNTPQGSQPCGTNGYKGFYYHFLDAKTGLRLKCNDPSEPVELSIIDTAILLAGILTVREYFSDNPDIVTLADNLYDRVEWEWFLDKSGSPDPDAPDYNPNYNQFYLGWSPEFGFQPWHWDYYTDENLLIDLLAIGSSTHPVPTDVFYAWKRVTRSYHDHDVIVSYNGSMFQYFFANIWFDLYGKTDAQGVNWWNNSVQAGLANRDFTSAGIDGWGRPGVSTYQACSWGMTANEGIPAGLHNSYLGGNGGRPNGNVDVDGGVNWQTEGSIAPYGSIGMIGFSWQPGGIPVDFITCTMQHFYQNTQLWTGWYGFRDAYTDANQIKSIKTYDPATSSWITRTATSLYPIYKAAYFSIDQGPSLAMIENYRTGLIWNTFMKNSAVQQAVSAVFD
jgi:hypothetical protein